MEYRERLKLRRHIRRDTEASHAKSDASLFWQTPSSDKLSTSLSRASFCDCNFRIHTRHLGYWTNCVVNSSFITRECHAQCEGSQPSCNTNFLAFTMSRKMDTDRSLNGQKHDRIEAYGLIPENDGNFVEASMTQKMLSATTGSILTSLLVTPLDVVRVRLQSQSHTQPMPPLPRPTTFMPPSQAFVNLPPNLGISTCCREVFWMNNNASYCIASAPSISVITNTSATSQTPSTLMNCAAEETQSKTYTSVLDGLRKIARNEGPTTLWRGLSPTLVMAVPANVIYFAGYDWLRANPLSPFRQIHMNDNYIPLAAGSSARVLAAIAVGPIEMFRTRMQGASSDIRSGGVFRETMTGMREMIASRGLPSMWTGLTLTLWRDVPFSAIYWWGYEYGRNALTNAREERRGRERITSRNPDAMRLRSRSRSQENHTNTLVDSFLAGAGSGAVAAFVTTPFDVGKTRQQVIRHAKVSGSEQATKLPEEQQMIKFLWSIYKEQGMSGLFRGWAARCLKIAPACAIMISSYEVGKKMARTVDERRDRR
jgi:solute carrier family 25 protein 39/40